MPKKSIHDKTVDWLVKRLEPKGRYTSIKKYVHYDKRKIEKSLQGEVDVLTFDESKDVYHFYEVKSSDTEGNYKKAQDQYFRFCKAYPSRDVKGIFVTPTCIMRL